MVLYLLDYVKFLNSSGTEANLKDIDHMDANGFLEATLNDIGCSLIGNVKIAGFILFSSSNEEKIKTDFFNSFKKHSEVI